MTADRRLSVPALRIQRMACCSQLFQRQVSLPRIRYCGWRKKAIIWPVASAPAPLSPGTVFQGLYDGRQSAGTTPSWYKSSIPGLLPAVAAPQNQFVNFRLIIGIWNLYNCKNAVSFGHSSGWRPSSPELYGNPCSPPIMGQNILPGELHLWESAAASGTTVSKSHFHAAPDWDFFRFNGSNWQGFCNARPE